MTRLRNGYSTGSCATACALASCLWQMEGEMPEQVTLTLGDTLYTPEIHALGLYRCAVIKDAGDDPDITDGCEVWAEVRPHHEDGAIRFIAGEGVGTVTKPGLKLPPGEAAINPVPRQMIEKAVRSVFGSRAADVTVGITGGANLALKTFNPRLGIEGGLSILGTTGIVHPMSEAAMVDTIRLELQMHRAQGADRIGLVFGSQGEKALRCLSPDLPCVQISNFVGDALDIAAELGLSRVLLAGQPGKLVKVAGGSMQTHSQYGDGRRETLIAHLALMGAPRFLLETVAGAVTLDGLIPQLLDSEFCAVFDHLSKAAASYARARTHDQVHVDILMLDSAGQVLGGFHDS
ncbi:MAG: cobalamin biosynthesis protein CbiD [Clostridia bacterium]|nr:cobalamin biosynthesis protein CbiD [Clostridia bacterium]